MKVAIYSRVSTAGQDDQGQYEELLELCERSRWTVVASYREKISGTKGPDHREQLKALLLAAKQRRFQKVVVWTVDRLGRSMRHLINTLGELHDAGIEVYAYRQESIRARRWARRSGA